MDDIHGKEIDLQKTTIKIPGANKPRIGKSFLNLEANKLQAEINSLNINANAINLASVNIMNPNIAMINTAQSTNTDLKGAMSDDMIASINTAQPGII